MSLAGLQDLKSGACQHLSSRPEELHPRTLLDLSMNLSIHMGSPCLAVIEP
jgi:hypothetical protein